MINAKNGIFVVHSKVINFKKINKIVIVGNCKRGIKRLPNVNVCNGDYKSCQLQTKVI